MPKRSRAAPQSEAEPEPEPDDDGDGMGLPTSCLDSCIRLEVTHVEPNYSLPWQYRHQTTSTSTGFIISGNRILTNAHCVDNFAVVKVKKRGDANKYIAEVVAIARDCDLALLTVTDRAFWSPTPRPIVLRGATDLPRLQDVVTVVGFPVGGDNMSITEGVVSRIDMQEYSHGCTELLVVQIDAAINPGNSGGPAFSEDHECVGVAFQSLKDGQTENIGYIIPTDVIHHFLDDVAKNGRYSGFCELGIELQRCENAALRACAGLAAAQTGLMVKSVHPMCPLPKDALRKGDVLTHFDGVALANDGTVPFRRGERIYFSLLISRKLPGESAVLRALRGGKKLAELTLTLPQALLLVPVESTRRKAPAAGTGACRDLRAPSYAVYGGLVFVPLCEPYLRSEFGDDFDAKAPLPLLDSWMHGRKEAEDNQVIVLSQVLAHKSNVGYEHLSNQLLGTCNGEKVRHLRHLVELVEASTERFVRFEVGPHGEAVTLEARQLREVTAEILAAHNISQPRSDDLM